MSKKLSDLLIISDVDGTLLHASQGIPKRNIDAITRFVEKGGHFALATGRPTESARHYVSQLPVNSPCILFNGGVIYDFKLEKELYTLKLPFHSREYLIKIQNRFPDIGTVALIGPYYYDISKNDTAQKLIVLEHVPMYKTRLEDIPDDWYKILFALYPEQMDELDSFVHSSGFDDVFFIRSNINYYEMLPKNCTKGIALENYIKICNVDKENIIAIGDYYNDFDFLQNAGFSATVSEAPDEIKKFSNKVFGSCEDGAVADLIEYLESIYMYN